jgi:hypothetical protein
VSSSTLGNLSRRDGTGWVPDGRIVHTQGAERLVVDLIDGPEARFQGRLRAPPISLETVVSWDGACASAQNQIEALRKRAETTRALSVTTDQIITELKRRRKRQQAAQRVTPTR